MEMQPGTQPPAVDVAQLAWAVLLLEQAQHLLKAAEDSCRLHSFPGTANEHQAGLSLLAAGAAEAAVTMASALGFATAGLETKASWKLRSARHLGNLPAGIGGVDRPLEPAVADALLLVRQVAEIYNPDTAREIDVALAANAPTSPPADRDAQRERRDRT
ncbi:hypothetical protein [Streptomyces sp. AK02-01A]|uniref:hypothetical protein n=1 Tax=Streptomyces sp. AK02-01A TaxID=3028648 RepID=UPI0029B6FDE8|nr:hypothetical protein [Streptomyces sp. AK02-01A]MDX3853713.1 hypothetical protein [Streptomyces sp. AK02-01A]